MPRCATSRCRRARRWLLPELRSPSQRELARDRSLHEGGAIAEQQLEVSRRNLKAAQAQLADAEARVALARQHVDDVTAESPMTGVVSDRPIHGSDVVQPGTHLFTIVNPGSMRLEASVPASDLTDVRVGAPVTFEVAGYPERNFEGPVTRINPAVDQATGRVRLFVSIPNDGQELIAGLFAQGAWRWNLKPA
jgi:RND family efflux transporter MFP subunit